MLTSLTGGGGMDLSSSSSATSTSSNNQSFAGMFGDKNLAKNDLTTPAVILLAGAGLYLFAKKKGLI